MSIPTLQSVNPYNNQLLEKYAIDSSAVIDSKITNSLHAFEQWKHTSLEERKQVLNNLAQALEQHKTAMAEMATLEMGKPIKQSLAEIEKSAKSIRYYAENAEKFLANEIIPTDAQLSYVSFQPLGTVLAIMPWNFPYWQVLRALGPIILAGNAMLLKHASNVMGCAQMIDKICGSVLPQNLLQVLYISSSAVEQVIAHPIVKAITLTGSSAAGSKVASVAGKYLKKQVLELGGNDAYIVMEDADLEEAAQSCVNARLNNTGQTCLAAKRWIVQENIANDFEHLVTQLMHAKKTGDPLDVATEIGPMARFDLRDELHEQVKQSIAMGAKLHFGGVIPDDEGAQYPVTLLSQITANMPAYKDELFGPVGALFTYKTIEEALHIVNDSIYGLGGGIFSKDVDYAQKLATQHFDSGNVFINDYTSSDPRLPFGGIKQSGYGRELSYYGIREFQNVKTIYVK